MRERRRIKQKYDVVVVGGGLSGVCAAIAAARRGAKVCIVQARPVFGGNASSEVRMHVCGASCHGRKENLAEAGILQELQLENKISNHTYSVRMWDMVLWNKIREEENITAHLNTAMDEVIMDGNTIKAIICRQSTTELIFEIEGDIFIDATGNATLGYYSGADFRVGSESRAEFGEPDAPEVPDNYTMGNTILFYADDLGRPVSYQKPPTAHTFTEEDLKDRPHGNTTVFRGENGIVEEYNVDTGYWWVELGGDSGDIIGETENLNAELYKCVFGIWDHLKNGGEHSAENHEMSWVGAIGGMRESRRLEGDYLLCENDITENRIFEDAVAYGGWPMDIHAPKGLFANDEPTRYRNFPGTYTIPYRCFYSKNIGNLMMAGRDISTSRMAFGSTRVMGTCAIGGQAAGTAAALAIKYGCTPREVGRAHIEELQQTLLMDDCYLPGYKNTDEKDLARTARVSASGFKKGFEPEKIQSGVTRPEGGESHAWESDGFGADGEKLTLTLDKANPLSEVRIVFDSNLTRELIVTMIKRVQKKQVEHLPLELVKDFTVTLTHGGKVVYEETVKNNNKRLYVMPLGESVVADTVTITVHSTYGYENARIYEVRLY